MKYLPLVLVALVGCNAAQNSSANKPTVRNPRPAAEPTEAGKAFRLAEEPAAIYHVTPLGRTAYADPCS